MVVRMPSRPTFAHIGLCAMTSGPRISHATYLCPIDLLPMTAMSRNIGLCANLRSAMLARLTFAHIGLRAICLLVRDTLATNLLPKIGLCAILTGGRRNLTFFA